MSRSRMKTPVFGNACCNSQKKDRTIANKQFRARERSMMSQGEFDILPVRTRECSNVWDFGKDGKHYWQPPRIKGTKDYELWRKYMRR